MPDDDEYDYGSLGDQDQREFLYDTLGFGEDALDQHAHDLFWDAFYNDELTISARIDIMDSLSDYLFEEYGIDFEEIWDWDDFRSWYDSA